MEVFYRYDSIVYSAGVDEFDNPIPGLGRVDVVCYEYQVLRRTPKGAWIALDFSLYDADGHGQGFAGRDKRFVLLTAMKRYACPTKKEALESFIARKNRYMVILNSRLRIAKQAAAIAERMIKKEVKDAV